MIEATRIQHSRRVLSSILAALLWGIAPGAAAEAPTEAPAGATLTLLAATCFNCHGTDGRLQDDGIPAIAGKPQQVLETQLQAFKQGQVPATVMDRIAGGFSDVELTALAAHFAALGAAPTDQR